jgi:hypothetical protein
MLKQTKVADSPLIDMPKNLHPSYSYLPGSPGWKYRAKNREKEGRMKGIYEEIKTPFKYGLVIAQNLIPKNRLSNSF